MTFNIQKLQEGGGMPPYLTYTPVTVNGAAPSAHPLAGLGEEDDTKSSKKSSEDKNKLSDKDLLSMLDKIDGLPNDMQAILKSIGGFYEMPDLAGGTSSTSSLANRYIQALAQVKTATFLKKEYDQAKELVVKNGGISEAAITDTGQIVVMDSDKNIKTVSIDTLKNSDGQYQILTNSKLLNLRAQDPRFALDNSLLGVVQNGVGMDAVNSYIQSISNKLGADSVGAEGYSQTESGKIAAGINFIKQIAAENQQGMSLSGIYKSSQTSQMQKKQAEQAIQYIYSTLPTNMKTLLKLRSDGTNKGAYDLICSLIGSGLSSTNEFKTSLVLDEEGNKVGSKKKESKEGNENKHTPSPAELFLSGSTYEDQVTLNPGTLYEYKALGYHGQISTKDGKALGTNDSLEDVSNSAWAPILDIEKATFGGNLLNSTGLNKLLLKSGDVIGMDLPIDVEAASKGIIKPDFATIKKLEQAEIEIKQGKIQDPKKINEICKKYGMPEKYTYNQKTGSWDLNNKSYYRFAVMHAIGDNTIFKTEHDPLDTTVSKVKDDNEVLNYEEIIKKNTKNDKYKMPTSGALWWSENELYSGSLFIPIRRDFISAAAFGGSSYKTPEKSVEDILEDVDANEVRKETAVATNYRKAPSLNSIM